ncbi:hypothetical protein JCM31826_01070 [Thermaurantimonas aggregans]|uniref:Uncharacterized protein n=1 Tax=Thermaurantimonas aggregans TaxID=2173829 RepID=A0A401XHZ4_9FLAO|nr:hypothetical protein [Thermaurantimonas aggregans]MCX8149184.1 hypothetical protein [Thermaurantimonas aggregans]GCD76625.1 hypothetical protein JCM31826_01070 [Thermaurantimonas aggregans]
MISLSFFFVIQLLSAGQIRIIRQGSANGIHYDRVDSYKSGWWIFGERQLVYKDPGNIKCKWGLSSDPRLNNGVYAEEIEGFLIFMLSSVVMSGTHTANRFGYVYPYVFTSSIVEENVYRLNLKTGKLECIYEEKNILSDALKSKYFRISTSVEIPKNLVLSMNDQNIPYRIHNLYDLDSMAVIYNRIEHNNKKNHLFILENDGENWGKRKIIL